MLVLVLNRTTSITVQFCFAGLEQLPATVVVVVLVVVTEKRWKRKRSNGWNQSSFIVDSSFFYLGAFVECRENCAIKIRKCLLVYFVALLCSFCCAGILRQKHSLSFSLGMSFTWQSNNCNCLLVKTCESKLASQFQIFYFLKLINKI